MNDFSKELKNSFCMTRFFNAFEQ